MAPSADEIQVHYYVGLEILLEQGISEPALFSYSAYKFKRIVGVPSFPDKFKIIQ